MDVLSHLPVGSDPDFDSSPASCFALDAQVSDWLASFPLDSRTVARATAADPTLNKLVHYLRSGWPRSSKHIADTEVRRFFAHRNELSLQDGVILLRCGADQLRVVVPTSLRAQVLQLLHEGHWGVVRTKQLARRHCTWKGIDGDIQRMMSRCRICAEHQSAPPRRFFSWPKATGPWQRLHVDFAGPFWNSRWLMLVDSYSNFPFVVPMSSTTATATVKILRSIFCLEVCHKRSSLITAHSFHRQSLLPSVGARVSNTSLARRFTLRRTVPRNVSCGRLKNI